MKNITKIANIVVLTILIGLSAYHFYLIENLQLKYMDVESANSRIDNLVAMRSETNHNIRILQEGLFANEIFEATKLLSKKLNIEEYRILFEDLKYSVSGDKVTGIELIISGPCDLDMQSCTSFTVDIETGVISKF